VHAGAFYELEMDLRISTRYLFPDPGPEFPDRKLVAPGAFYGTRFTADTFLGF
jgi:hypothetical protein